MSDDRNYFWCLIAIITIKAGVFFTLGFLLQPWLTRIFQ